MTDPLRHGDKIPGSFYYRCFCVGCGAPMRCRREDLAEDHWCEQCDPPRIGLGNASAARDATSPGWENAVRALEDGAR